MTAKKKVTKKKVTKKRATKKKVAKKVVLRAENHPVVEDFFDDETGELLNPKHEMFTQMWVQTFDRRKALKAGGYTDPGDSRMNLYTQSQRILKREEIQLRVRAILRERVTAFSVDENFIVMNMIDVYHKAIEERPITNGDGEIIGAEYKDLKVAQTTLQALGTNLGMFQKQKDDKATTVIINNNYGTDAPEPKQIPALEGQSKRLN